MKNRRKNTHEEKLKSKQKEGEMNEDRMKKNQEKNEKFICFFCFFLSNFEMKNYKRVKNK